MWTEGALKLVTYPGGVIELVLELVRESFSFLTPKVTVEVGSVTGIGLSVLEFGLNDDGLTSVEDGKGIENQNSCDLGEISLLLFPLALQGTAMFSRLLLPFVMGGECFSPIWSFSCRCRVVSIPAK